MAKMKILYVDDEPINLSNFRMTFEDEFEVLTASSGSEAMALFAEHVDTGLAVVVSDNRMPGMSGVEFMGRIFHADPDPMRIVLTAFTDFDEIMQAVNQGHIYQYVLKPWDENSLRMLLRNAVRAYSMIKMNKKMLRELEQKNIDLEKTTAQLLLELKRRNEQEALRRIAEGKMLDQAKLASLGEMATGIAHEINNPLFFIKIVMEAVKRDFEEGRFDAEEFSGEIDEFLCQVKRIEIIVKHLQIFGHKSGGEFCQILLPPVLEDALIPLRHRLKKKGIALEIDIEEDLPMVCGVATRLEQVFINLINNAIDGLKNVHKKKLTINFVHQNDAVSVSFADNGCGVSEEVAAKMFEPFFTTKEVGKGTGLGLSISYGILKEHNGSITCHSKLGEGCTFTVSLPTC